MYGKKDRMGQKEIKFVSLEDLVPEEHLLRKIDAGISFELIYDEVKGMYSEADWGNPGIDPVALFKIVFIQILVRNPEYAANDTGNGGKQCVPMVHRLRFV